MEPGLLHTAKAMDQDALLKIFELYASALYRYALRLGNDPALADEIVGDVFVKLLEQLASGNGPDLNLRSYLYQSAYHCLVDEARLVKRSAPLEVIDWHPHPRIPEFRYMEDKLLFEQVVDAVKHDLTPDQRHVIVLRFIEEFSLRETATILGKEVSHVKVIQGRALAKLRQALEQKRIAKTRPSLRMRLAKVVGI